MSETPIEEMSFETAMAELEDGEFDFSQAPALGGPLGGEFNVEFTMEPTNMGETIMAILDDTCGNLIQIIQMKDA